MLVRVLPPPALAGEGARLGDAEQSLVAAGEGAVGASRLVSNAPSRLRLNSPKKIGLAKSRASPARGRGGIFLQRSGFLHSPDFPSSLMLNIIVSCDVPLRRREYQLNRNVTQVFPNRAGFPKGIAMRRTSTLC